MPKQPPTETLVNEKKEPRKITDLSPEERDEELQNSRFYIVELEQKNNRLIEKKDRAEKENTELKVELEDANRRAATHGLKAQRMRVFCELINGAAMAGAFRPFHATNNPTGVKNNTDIENTIKHYAGIAEVAVGQVDKRF